MSRALARVAKCGHKFDPNRIPRRNCEDCWEAFFKTSVNLDELHDQLNLPDGIRLVTNMRGERYVKMFRRFLDRELMGTFQDSVDKNAELLGALAEERIDDRKATRDVESPRV